MLSARGEGSSLELRRSRRRWQSRYATTHHSRLGIAALLTRLASQIKGQKSKAVDISSKQTSAPSKLSRIKLTDGEKKKLQERIRNATSLQEIIALEKELNEGRLPSGVQGDAMEE